MDITFSPVKVLCAWCGAEWPVDYAHGRLWGRVWIPERNRQYIMSVPSCVACWDRYHHSLWARIRIRCLIWYWDWKHRRREATAAGGEDS